MKYENETPSFRYAVALIGITVSGLALSMHLTTDPRWMQWHLSRLGEGGHFSSAIFNFTMGIIAILLVLLSTRLVGELFRAHNTWRLRVLYFLFLVAAVFCVGVACFPFDTFPGIHNIFGHGGALALVVVMIGLPWLYPFFPRRVYYTGVLSALFVSILFAIYLITGAVSLLSVELIGQVFLFGWLLVLTYEARRLSGRT